MGIPLHSLNFNSTGYWELFLPGVADAAAVGHPFAKLKLSLGHQLDEFVTAAE